MTTLDRLVVSIAIVGLMAMICVTPFYTRDLVVRGLPERRECDCAERQRLASFTNTTLTADRIIGHDATSGPRFIDLNAQLIGTNAADTKRLNLGMTNTTPDFANFCAVRGHIWGTHLHTTLEHAPNRIACRECKVCGLHQERYATEWK